MPLVVVCRGDKLHSPNGRFMLKCIKLAPQEDISFNLAGSGGFLKEISLCKCCFLHIRFQDLVLSADKCKKQIHFLCILYIHLFI